MNDNVLFLMCYIPTPVILLVAGLVIWRFPAPYGSAVTRQSARMPPRKHGIMRRSTGAD